MADALEPLRSPGDTDLQAPATGWTGGRQLLRELVRDKVALVGAVLTLLFVLCAVFGPLLVSDIGTQVSIERRLLSPLGGEGSGLLGTDALGRDVASRLVEGARTSLVVSLLVILVGGVTGTALGVLSGFVGGLFDTIVSRYVEIQGAFPALLLALLVLAIIDPSIGSMVIVLSVERIPYFVKVARAATLSIRHLQYVEGAELIGCSRARVIGVHVLPGVAPAVMSLAILEFVHVILAEATLSYLGFGVQPPAVSWGLMINEGQQYIFGSWWLIAFPGLAVMLTVVGMNLLGSWLQTSLNPHERQKRFVLRPSREQA